MNKAVFLDRDGVLNPDNDDCITSISNLSLYENAGNIIAYFRNNGFKIFVITNQPVIARGLLTENGLNLLHIDYQKLLLSQDKDAHIDKFYFCPHHPNASVEEYRTSCDCRKPKPGMILKAAVENSIDLKSSYMVGDRISDIIAGHLADCKTVQILSGRHNDKMIQTDLAVDREIKPDFVINSLLELKDIIK